MSWKFHPNWVTDPAGWPANVESPFQRIFKESPMRGLMMDTPLLISSLLEYAAVYHAGGEH